jgi:hypothetical protein
MTAPRVRWPIEDDYLYDGELDRYMPGRLTLDCPICGRTHKPLLSKLTVRLSSYWSWIALSYNAPHTDYEATCSRTGRRYRFTTYTPQ